MQDVLAEGQLAAERRADMMGWADVELIYTSVMPTKNGNVNSYSFDIWGVGESMIDPVINDQNIELEMVKQGQAAKDAEI